MAANGTMSLSSRLSNIPCVRVYMGHVFFTRSSVDGRLGSFCVLGVVNSAAVSMGGLCLFELLDLQIFP